MVNKKPQRGPGRPSTIRAFGALIVDLVRDDPSVPTARILSDLRDAGYTGSKSTAYAHVATLRAQEPRERTQAAGRSDSARSDNGTNDLNLARALEWMRTNMKETNRDQMARTVALALIPRDRAHDWHMLWDEFVPLFATGSAGFAALSRTIAKTNGEVQRLRRELLRLMFRTKKAGQKVETAALGDVSMHERLRPSATCRKACEGIKGAHLHCAVCGRAWHAKRDALIWLSVPHEVFPSIKLYAVRRQVDGEQNVVYTGAPTSRDAAVVTCPGCAQRFAREVFVGRDLRWFRRRGPAPRLPHDLGSSDPLVLRCCRRHPDLWNWEPNTVHKRNNEAIALFLAKRGHRWLRADVKVQVSLDEEWTGTDLTATLRAVQAACTARILKQFVASKPFRVRGAVVTLRVREISEAVRSRFLEARSRGILMPTDVDRFAAVHPM